ncbi:MAG: TRAP transporter substrate-binding protein [Planctomycetota bacterium]|jgi:tripartite ATP-independent transporter DctP family solute receptor|nr:TRAP transporter substrate-binding protein [Planctomycetota bacterium]
MRKRMGVLLVVLSAAGFMLAPARPAEAAARKLTIGHVFAVDHPVHVALLETKTRLEDKSGGKFTLEIFPNATYANYKNAIQAVRMGALDMCPLDTAADYLEESGVMLGPYTFTNYDHWARFKKSDVYRELKDKISDAVGVKQLAIYNFGFRNATGNKIYTKPADYERVKLRVVDFAPYPEIAVVLNAIPTPLPVGDIYMALQTGVADAQENPLTQIVTMKLYEVQKYVMLTEHMLATSGTIMSKRCWDSLTPGEQALLEDAFEFEADFIDKMVVEKEQELIEFCKKQGVEVLTVDKTPFIERVPLVHKKYPAWIPLYNKIQDLLK